MVSIGIEENFRNWACRHCSQPQRRPSCRDTRYRPYGHSLQHVATRQLPAYIAFGLSTPTTTSFLDINEPPSVYCRHPIPHFLCSHAKHINSPTNTTTTTHLLTSARRLIPNDHALPSLTKNSSPAKKQNKKIEPSSNKPRKNTRHNDEHPFPTRNSPPQNTHLHFVLIQARSATSEDYTSKPKPRKTTKVTPSLKICGSANRGKERRRLSSRKHIDFWFRDINVLRKR